MLLLSSLAIPVAAQEDPEEAPRKDYGLYLELAGGSTRSLDQDASFNGPLGAFSGDADFAAGYNVGAALGARLKQLRFEVDARYRDANIDNLNFVGDTEGGLVVRTAIANLYYDIDFGWPIHPFIGGGVGAADLDLRLTRRRSGLKFRDNSTELAWNVMGGLGVDVADWLELFVRYRRVGSTEGTFSGNLVPGNPGKLKLDYSANEFEMGFRFTFFSF